jgi:hypothetical protein
MRTAVGSVSGGGGTARRAARARVLVSAASVRASACTAAASVAIRRAVSGRSPGRGMIAAAARRARWGMTMSVTSIATNTSPPATPSSAVRRAAFRARRPIHVPRDAGGTGSASSSPTGWVASEPNDSRARSSGPGSPGVSGDSGPAITRRSSRRRQGRTPCASIGRGVRAGKAP